MLFLLLTIFLILFLIPVVTVIRVALVLREIHRARSTGRWHRPFLPNKKDENKLRNGSKTKKRPLKTLVVLGSGGHTTEMLSLIAPLLQHDELFEFVYCKADTDTTSIQRLTSYITANTTTNTANNNNIPQNVIYSIPRSREVGQSYITSIYTTLYAFVWSLKLVFIQVRPDLLLCNGPGTCLPLCVAAILGRVLFLLDCPIVFVESLCRVETLSLTGKLLYPVADFFGVHWKELQERYPKSTRVSNFVLFSSKLD